MLHFADILNRDLLLLHADCDETFQRFDLSILSPDALHVSLLHLIGLLCDLGLLTFAALGLGSDALLEEEYLLGQESYLVLQLNVLSPSFGQLRL
jgi:hypothetical protein